MNDNKSNPIISVDEKRFDSDNHSEDYQAYENLVKETIDYESLEVAFCVIFYWFMSKKKESEVTVHAE